MRACPIFKSFKPSDVCARNDPEGIFGMRIVADMGGLGHILDQMDLVAKSTEGLG
jgi:hypothetical protein